jgi:hypothetical protein
VTPPPPSSECVVKGSECVVTGSECVVTGSECVVTCSECVVTRLPSAFLLSLSTVKLWDNLGALATHFTADNAAQAVTTVAKLLSVGLHKKNSARSKQCSGPRHAEMLMTEQRSIGILCPAVQHSTAKNTAQTLKCVVSSVLLQLPTRSPLWPALACAWMLQTGTTGSR